MENIQGFCFKNAIFDTYIHLDLECSVSSKESDF